MGNEKLTPPTKSMPGAGGITQGGSHRTLTTPNFDAEGGNANWNKEQDKGNIFGKK